MVIRTLRLACVAALALAPCAAQAQTPTKITAGQIAPSVQQWPQYLAQELGWYGPAGLALDLVNVGASGPQQLAAGSLDLHHSGFPDFVRAAMQGAPLKIVVNDVGVPPYNLYAKPAIKTLADLKGKTVSIGAIRDVTLIYLKAMLASVKMQSTDVDLIFAKAAGDRFRALASGAVDAAIINPPSSFRAQALGFTNLGDVEPFTGPFPFTVWAASDTFMAKHRDALVSFIKVYTRAVGWLYDVANKKQAVDILMKYVPQDRADAEQSYDYLITKLHMFVPDGKLDDAVYAKMMQGQVEIGDITPPGPAKASVFDASFVDAAAR